MANVLLGYQNRADDATLSGGSWTVGLPLTNLQNRVLSNPARSSDALVVSTKFNVTLDKARPVRVIGLIRHNISTGGLHRFTAYSDAGRTTLVYDSGWLDTWPAIYDVEDLEWEDDNFWELTISEEDRAGFQWNVFHCPTDLVYERYWTVEVNDTDNDDGYVEIGRLFVGNSFSPDTNMSYGQSIGYESRSSVEEAWDGTEYFDERLAPRVIRFSFEWLSTDEAMRVLDIQRVSDITKELAVIYDPDETAQAVRRSFLGRIRKLSEIEQHLFEIHGTAFEVKELL